MKGKELAPLGGNRADPGTGMSAAKVVAAALSFLKGDGNSRDNSEDSRCKVSGSPPPPQGKPNPPAGRPGTSVRTPDAAHVRASLEGRSSDKSEETLQSVRELDTAFPRLEQKVLELDRLVFMKDEEIATLQSQNQKFRELITTCNSRAGQAVEVQERSLSKIKTAIGKLHEDVNCLPLFRNDFLSIDIARAIGEPHNDKCGVHGDLRACHKQLDSAKLEAKLLKEDILKLEEVNGKLEQRVTDIQQQLCKEKAGQHGSYVDSQQTPFLWESTAKDMLSSIANFNRLLSKYTDSNENNPAHAFICGSGLWNGVRIARDHHWTHLLKSFVCTQLFADFEYETLLGLSNTVLFLDHEKRVRDCFEYFHKSKSGRTMDKAALPPDHELLDVLFFYYFQSRLQLLPDDAGGLCRQFFTNHDDLIQACHHKMLSMLQRPAEIHRYQNLVISFVMAAKKVWDFHKLCLSFEPPATIFRVAPGEPFNAGYMESIDIVDFENDDRDYVPKVGFMTYPGFRLRKSIIKCQVYLA